MTKWTRGERGDGTRQMAVKDTVVTDSIGVHVRFEPDDLDMHGLNPSSIPLVLTRSRS